jgi:hypothetical protein
MDAARRNWFISDVSSRTLRDSLRDSGAVVVSERTISPSFFIWGNSLITQVLLVSRKFFGYTVRCVLIQKSIPRIECSRRGTRRWPILSSADLRVFFRSVVVFVPLSATCTSEHSFIHTMFHEESISSPEHPLPFSLYRSPLFLFVRRPISAPILSSPRWAKNFFSDATRDGKRRRVWFLGFSEDGDTRK